MKLYTWTCLDHGADPIRQSGLIIPKDQPALGVKLSWWTHIPFASRQALGLSSYTLTCDRMGVQFVTEVEPNQVTDWTSFKRWLIQEHPETAPVIRALEASPGAKPAWWWVAPTELPVTEVIERA